VLALGLVLAMGSCKKPGIRDLSKVHYFPGTEAELGQVPTIRVALVLNAKEADVSCRGPCALNAEPGGKLIESGPGFRGAKLVAATDGFRLLGRPIKANGFIMRPARDGSLSVGGITYRGELKVVKEQGGRLSIINLVNLEDYLAGVLGSEMPLNWPDAALRAQAIASRSYAVYQMKERKGHAYDLKSTVQDQAYLGMKRETSKSRRIVQETRGIVILYKWRFFPVYFHSTCGGHTEDAGNVFQMRTIGCLQGRPCGYCSASKYYTWRFDIGEAELRKKLSSRIRRLGTIVAVEPLERTKSGRATKVKVVHTRGTSVMDAYEFRRAVGVGLLRGTNFTVKKSGSKFHFSGRGWGHGVGMCQFGAKGLAETGKDCLDILSFYYRDIEFVRIY